MKLSVILAGIGTLSLPILSQAQLITAGELTVDLRGSDLNSSSTSWINHDTTGDTVGNFSTLGGGNLNAVTIGGYQGLFVNGNGANSVNSALAPMTSMLGTSVGSVEAWVYVPGSFVADNTVVAWGVNNNSGSAYRGFRYAAPGAYNSGLFTAWYQDKAWDEPSDLISDQWVHLAWIYDGANVKGYVNGALETTVGLSPTLNTLANTAMSIGGRNGGSGADAFRGYIGDVRVHTGILSDTDVLNNFTIGMQVVPEPSSLALVGLAGLAFRFLRRHS